MAIWGKKKLKRRYPKAWMAEDFRFQLKQSAAVKRRNQNLNWLVSKLSKWYSKIEDIWLQCIGSHFLFCSTWFQKVFPDFRAIWIIKLIRGCSSKKAIVGQNLSFEWIIFWSTKKPTFQGDWIHHFYPSHSETRITKKNYRPSCGFREFPVVFNSKSLG